MANLSSNPRLHSVNTGLSHVFFSSLMEAERIAWEISKVVGWSVNDIIVTRHNLKHLPPRLWLIFALNGKNDMIMSSTELKRYPAVGMDIASAELATTLKALGFRHV